MNTKRVPWISLWLIVFAAACAWLLTQPTSYRISYGPYIAPLILSAMVFAALRDIYFSFLRTPGQYEPSRLNQIALLYLDAWRILWRQKWLVRLFGAIGVINLAGGIFGLALSNHYLLTRLKNMQDPNDFATRLLTSIPPMEYLTNLLPGRIGSILSKAPADFYPSLGLPEHPLASFILAGIIAVAVLLLYRYISSIQIDPDSVQDAAFLKRWLIMTAIVCIPTAFLLGKQYIGLLTMLQSRMHPTMYLAVGFVWAIIVVIINSTLIAGLIGGLARIGNSENTEPSYFVADIIRNFKPILGLSMLILLVGTLLNLPGIILSNGYSAHQIPVFLSQWSLHAFNLVMTLLMFVPYVIVSKRLGVFDGIAQGVKFWLSNAGATVSLIAFGTTLVTIKAIITGILGAFVPSASVLGYALIPFNVMADMLITAIIVITTWEFYSAISEDAAITDYEEE